MRLKDKHRHFWKAYSEVQTTYDASYLELAIRLDLPLATLDSDLYNAAVEVGVAHQMATN